MAIAVAAAVVVRLVGGHPFPDYDATFALIWGHDLAHGHAPDYALPYRPAGHPLLLLATTVAAPLGRDAAAEVVRWLALLGGGFCVAAVFRIGQAAFGTVTGVLAAVLLATRTPMWSLPLLAYMDPLAAAFVLWALVLELRRPRRGAPVLVLLGLAGLVRPEVWLFAAAYWIWLALASRERGLRLLPLAALGPLGWIAWDLLSSGTFLGSLTSKSGAPVGPSSGGHGLGHAPHALASYVGGFARPPEAVAAAVGIGIALWWRDRRVLLPAALLALNVLSFVVVAARNGPLEQRYLVVAGALTVLLAAYAIAALASRAGPARIAGVVLALACAAYAPVDLDRIADLRDQVHVASAVDTELQQLVRAPGARCALRGHLHLPDVRLRPFVAYWAGTALERIDTGPGGSGELAATDSVAQQLVSRSLPTDTARAPVTPPHPAPGFRVVAASRGWRLTGDCGGGQ